MPKAGKCLRLARRPIETRYEGHWLYPGGPAGRYRYIARRPTPSYPCNCKADDLLFVEPHFVASQECGNGICVPELPDRLPIAY